jgi:hypothetical protein
MPKPSQYEDALLDFSGGMNSGVAPLLLAKNQLAFAMNASLRGGFLKTRPPIKKLVLDFNGDAGLQQIVLHGLFQGAAYYRPDYGAESLLAQISGHLILFTNNVDSWLVSDVSIAGDLNDPGIFQVWMWQAEKWMIIQDGTGKLPIFFDGTSSRRSHGPGVLWGTTAADFTPPAIGETVTITLDSDFAGRYHEPFILNGEFYEALSGTEVGGQPTYLATITNVGDAPGITIPVGTSILSIPSTSSTNITLNRTLTQDFVLAKGQCIAAGFVEWTAVASTTVGLVPGNVIINDQYGDPQTWAINAAGDLSWPTQYCNPYPNTFHVVDTWPAGQVLQTVTHTGVAATLGIVAEAFIVPSVGNSVLVKLTSLYTGPLQQCTINGQPYKISKATQPAPPGPSTVLTVKNISDTSTSVAAFPKTLYSVPEIPAGRMGAYGMGCNCVCLTDGLSYIIGDVVGAGSGTSANGYRDAVLKMTQSSFLVGGGAFRLPGSGDIITAVFFPPLMDSSLGHGPLQIGTAFSIWSNYVVGTYPGTWSTLTNPIQTESLKDKGPLAQNSTIIVNSDTFFRSAEGVGTLILARRDFGSNTWGNRPSSNEIQRVLNPDSQSLLSYGSGMTFDNRYFTTLSPIISPHGVYHIGFGVMNFDLISSLRETLQPSWEGAWTGINALQVLTGRVNGVKRAFAFTFNINQNNIIELYEFLPDNTTSYQDNDQVPIFWVFETPLIFSRDIKSLNELCQLRDGEVYLSNIQGDVKVKVLYRPDYYPCWSTWREFEVCQSIDAANSQPGYRMRIGLGEPDVTPCEAGNNRPLRDGYFFQLRFEITGSCVFKGIRVSAIPKPQQEFAPVECSKMECQIIDCDVPQDLYEYSLQGTIPPAPPPPPPPPPGQDFKNLTVYSSVTCVGIISYVGTLPAWITIDTVNNKLIGASGTYSSSTQAAANALAQVALDQFKQAASTSNALICVPATLGNLVWSVVPGGDWLAHTPSIWFWCQYKTPGDTFQGLEVNINCFWNLDVMNLHGALGYCTTSYANNTGTLQNVKVAYNGPPSWGMDITNICGIRIIFMAIPTGQNNPIGIPTGASSYAGYWQSISPSGQCYVYVGYASDASGTGYSVVPANGLNYYAVLASTSPVSPTASSFSGLWKNHGSSELLYVAYASDNLGSGYSTNPGTGLKFYAAIFPSDYPLGNNAAVLFDRFTTGDGNIYGTIDYFSTPFVTVPVAPHSTVILKFAIQSHGDPNFAAGSGICLTTSGNFLLSLA